MDFLHICNYDIWAKEREDERSDGLPWDDDEPDAQCNWITSEGGPNGTLYEYTANGINGGPRAFVTANKKLKRSKIYPVDYDATDEDIEYIFIFKIPRPRSAFMNSFMGRFSLVRAWHMVTNKCTLCNWANEDGTVSKIVCDLCSEEVYDELYQYCTNYCSLLLLDLNNDVTRLIVRKFINSLCEPL